MSRTALLFFLLFVISHSGPYVEAGGQTGAEPPQKEIPPVANAGHDRSARAGTAVILDGSGSVDPGEAYPLSYRWTLVSAPGGSCAFIRDSAAMTTLLFVDMDGTYHVDCTVINAKGVRSDSDRLIVSTRNGAPVADPGSDTALKEIGIAIALDGSTSFDPEGEPLFFRWAFVEKPVESAADIVGSTSQVAHFTPDIYGRYTVGLTVSDPGGLRGFATRSFGFGNFTPSADAGNTVISPVDHTVQLDGGGSRDPDGGPLSFSWTMVRRPDSSVAVLTDRTSATPLITPDVAGDYVFSLTVSDGTSASTPSITTVTAYSAGGALVDAIKDAVNAMNLLDCQDFRNLRLRYTLGRELAVILGLIRDGDRGETSGMLGGILGRMDGCGNERIPDEDDWIIDCAAQELVRPFIDEAVELREKR